MGRPDSHRTKRRPTDARSKNPSDRLTPRMPLMRPATIVPIVANGRRPIGPQPSDSGEIARRRHAEPTAARRRYANSRWSARSKRLRRSRWHWCPAIESSSSKRRRLGPTSPRTRRPSGRLHSEETYGPAESLRSYHPPYRCRRYERTTLGRSTASTDIIP